MIEHRKGRTRVGLGLSRLVGGVERDLALGVVVLDKVLENRVRLPDSDVAILVVDDGGDLAVRVELHVGLGLLLLVNEVHVDVPMSGGVREKTMSIEAGDQLIGETELLHGKAELPLVHSTVVVAAEAREKSSMS